MKFHIAPLRIGYVWKGHVVPPPPHFTEQRELRPVVECWCLTTLP